jgi:hypothetical protein
MHKVSGNFHLFLDISKSVFFLSGHPNPFAYTEVTDSGYDTDRG